MSKTLPLLLLTASLATMVFLFGPVAIPHPFTYDESDYMWAGTQGFRANFTDRNGLPFPEFVRKGLELRNNPEQRATFSQYIRASGDIGMYRHYHGPVYFYWIAAMQAAGATTEAAFRGSGLILHGVTAVLIWFLMRRAFPDLPAAAGGTAVLSFLFARTTVSATTLISQHLAFTFWTIPVLFAYGHYLTTGRARWAYVGAVLNGIALGAVETACLLTAAFGLSLLADVRTQFALWPGWKARLGFLVRLLGAMIAGILLVWPMGVLQLNAMKGFLQLAYMAVYRKTFSPFTLTGLLHAKWTASPVELTFLPLGVLIAAWLYFQRPAQRKAWLPWLAFTALFCGVLVKITLEYTYYYAPLAAAMCVLSGLAAGELWRQRKAWGVLMLTAAAVTAAISGISFRGVMADIAASRPYHYAALDFLRQQKPAPGTAIHLPFQLLPPAHYYQPDKQYVGHDYDWPPERFTLALRGAHENMLCEKPICDLIERQGLATGERQLLDPKGPTEQPLYMLRLRPQPEAR